jgi:hypothetical protein
VGILSLWNNEKIAKLCADLARTMMELDDARFLLAIEHRLPGAMRGNLCKCASCSEARDARSRS